MKLTAEWGIIPVNPHETEFVEFGSMEIENASLRTAKGHIFKHVKADTQVIEAFSSEGQDWDPSASRWADWSPEEPFTSRPGYLFTERRSEDVCLQKIGNATCVVYIRLTWQDPKIAKQSVAEVAEESAAAGDAA